MKRVALVLLLLAAAGAAAWFLWLRGGGDSAGPGEGGGADATPAETAPKEAAAGAGPTLASGTGRGAGRTRRAAADAPRGGGGIVGTVRRGPAPAAARVELRLLLETGGTDVLAGGMGGLFDLMLSAPASASPAAATTRAGEDGRFAFEGLGAGIYVVNAVADDGARGGARAVLPVDGVRVEAVVALSAGGESLRGRVVYADGRPWQGLVVLLPSSGGRDFDEVFLPSGNPLAVAVDAEGRFVATGLAPGAVTVGAVDPGKFRAVSRPVPLPHEGEYVMTVDGEFLQLTGKVLADADGTPVAGADVLAGGEAASVQFAIGRTTTDADGSFRLPLPKGRESGLIVRAAGYAPTMVERPGIKDTIEVRLVRGARVVGRVTLEGSGKPVAGARVAATTKGMDGPFLPDPATTDADGRYEVKDLAAGEATLVATGPGVVTKDLATIDRQGYNPLAVTLTPGETATLDIVVVPGARAQGKVLDAEGRPVAGASVTAAGGGEDEFRSPMRFLFGGGTVAASGADGSFVFDALTSGTPYSFEANAPGHGGGRAGPLTVTAGAPVTFEIRMAAARRLEVTVLDAGSGQAVAGARIQGGVRAENWRPASAVSDAGGKAVLEPLDQGDVRLRVEAQGYVTQEGVQVEAQEAATVVRLVRGLVLSGHVRLPAGGPAAGARVNLQAEGLWLRETTGVDGTFRFRGVPPETPVTLHVSAQDGERTLSATQEIASVGSGEVAITLESGAGADRSGALTVRVLGPDGKPVPRAQARFQTENGSWGQGVADGEVRFDNLGTRKEGHVVVWAPTTREGAALPYGQVRVGPVAPDVAEVEVRMPPEAVISGVVRTPEGRGLRGVAVEANLPEAGSEAYSRFGSRDGAFSARTGEDGAFRLGGLGDAVYALTFRTPPEYVVPARVEVRAGASDVVVVLKRAAAVAITVIDAAGKPVAGANVGVRTPGGREPGSRGEEASASAVTDASGVARVPGLDAETAYTLSVAAPQDRDDLKASPPVANWMPRNETIRLERAYVVKGVVLDLAGNPVARATVMRKVGGGWNGTGTDEAGAFTIRDLPPGPVVLRAQVGGGFGPSAPGQPEPPATTVQAGDRDVVLRVDPGLEVRVVVEGWGRDRWGQAVLTADSAPPGQGQVGHESLRPGQETRFRGLKADTTYTLFVGPTNAGLSALVTGVRAPAELKVRLQPGKSITVRVVAPQGATDVSAQADLPSGGAHLWGRPGTDGRIELRGAPEGTTWKVRASARVGDVPWSGEVDAAAGASVEIEVKPRTPGR